MCFRLYVYQVWMGTHVEKQKCPNAFLSAENKKVLQSALFPPFRVHLHRFVRFAISQIIKLIPKCHSFDCFVLILIFNFLSIQNYEAKGKAWHFEKAKHSNKWVRRLRLNEHLSMLIISLQTFNRLPHLHACVFILLLSYNYCTLPVIHFHGKATLSMSSSAKHPF